MLAIPERELGVTYWTSRDFAVRLPAWKDYVGFSPCVRPAPIAAADPTRHGIWSRRRDEITGCIAARSYGRLLSLHSIWASTRHAPPTVIRVWIESPVVLAAGVAALAFSRTRAFFKRRPSYSSYALKELFVGGVGGSCGCVEV